MKNFRFWTRALSDDEAEQVDTMSNVMCDDAPKYAPSGSVWNYFPMDQNMFSTTSASTAPALNLKIAVEVNVGTSLRGEAFLAPFAPVSRLAAA
jgi:hypothetical protein